MYARAGQFFSAVFLFSIWFPFVYLHCSVWNLLVLFWALYCFLSIQNSMFHALGFVLDLLVLFSESSLFLNCRM